MTGLKGEPGESISSPEVTVSPRYQTVSKNQTAIFYCSASGNPRPVVTWGKVNESLGETILSTDDGKLEIPSSSYNDTGNYICTAVNALGQDQKTTKLFVEGGQPLYYDYSVKYTYTFKNNNKYKNIIVSLRP